ncbi:type II toxin-antitoxin system HicA family toxin [Methyloprofundus sp.]|uniref:type II toxin-antitoxin system HicA family toxin n=1 Tax=Methyloprofundus sp. TaxID=2020875 RepID=UPI003D10F650
MLVLIIGTIHKFSENTKKLELIFHRPVSGNIKWNDIESLFIELGAEISERESSRIGVRLFNTRKVFHRPHPSLNTDKGAVASIREWLRENKVVPK